MYEYCFIARVTGSGSSKVFNRYGEIHFPMGKVQSFAEQPLSKVLDSLGKEGWEMVGCGSTEAGNEHHIYFKRRAAW